MVAGKTFAPFGGHQLLVRAYALAAARAGFSVHVVDVTIPPSLEAAEFGTLHRIAAPLPRSHLAEPVHRAFLVRAITRLVERECNGEPVIVHGFGPWAATAVAARRALARRDTVAVSVASAYTTHRHEHGAMLQSMRGYRVRVRLQMRLRAVWVKAWCGRAELRGYRDAQLLLANYESVRQLLLASCGPDLEVKLFPYATPAAFADDRARVRPVPPAIEALTDRDAPLIVAVSRHDLRKGYEVLLPALSALAQAGVRFRACLVGPGRLLEAHRRSVAQLGLADRVACPGYVEDVFDYLVHADIFVLPSTEEGSGSLSVLEALQAGLAIVASRLDGLPEDLTDGRDALLVEPGSVEELTSALGVLLGDAALRRKLGAAARETFAERFSAARLTSALGALYRELSIR